MKAKVIVIQSIIILIMGVVIFMIGSELGDVQKDLDKCEKAFSHQRGILQGVIKGSNVEHMKAVVCEEQLKLCRDTF